MSATTFALARANLRYLRGVLPSYHDVLQKGTTQLIDLLYMPELPDLLPDAETLDTLLPGASGFQLPDHEGGLSDTTVLMLPLYGHPDEAEEVLAAIDDGVLPPEPRVRMVLKRAAMRDGSGMVRWVTEQVWMTEHDSGRDAPVHDAAFCYHGPPAMPGSEHPYPSVYHVQRATGKWATATNVLVVPGPPGWRKLFVSRTVNEQTAAPGAPRLAL